MTQIKDNLNSCTGKHLSYEERVKIEAYKELGTSNREIARILGRAPQTINNAVNRGTVRTIKQRQIHNDKVYEYDQYDYSAEADDKMLKKGWSPDMVVRRARKENIFTNDSIPSTSTLYHWIDRGILKTKNIDVLENVSRKPGNDSPTHREDRRVLNPSIKEWQMK